MGIGIVESQPMVVAFVDHEVDGDKAGGRLAQVLRGEVQEEPAAFGDRLSQQSAGLPRAGPGAVDESRDEAVRPLVEPQRV